MTPTQLKAKLIALAVPKALYKVCPSRRPSIKLTRAAKDTPNLLLNNGQR